MEIEDYGCDICHERKHWDDEIIWLTSSYGLCEKCYDSISEEEREELRVKYE